MANDQHHSKEFQFVNYLTFCLIYTIFYTFYFLLEVKKYLCQKLTKDNER